MNKENWTYEKTIVVLVAIFGILLIALPIFGAAIEMVS